MINFGKLTYLDLVLAPQVADSELARYLTQLNTLFKRMAGTSKQADRVVTVGDLDTVAGVQWTDYNIGSQSLGVTATAPPDLIAVNSTSIYARAFDGGSTTEQVFGTIELNHNYAEGTDIYFHVHWFPTTTNAGNVQWKLDYMLAKNGKDLPAIATVTGVGAASEVAWKMETTELARIDGALFNIGDQFMFRLYRSPSDAADTYAYDAAVATVGLHVQVNTFGSKQKTIK
jgi:hypothetical protein